jgi:hypothetical protein
MDDHRPKKQLPSTIFHIPLVSLQGKKNLHTTETMLPSLEEALLEEL